jgi:two pore calcium channel protein
MPGGVAEQLVARTTLDLDTIHEKLRARLRAVEQRIERLEASPSSGPRSVSDKRTPLLQLDADEKTCIEQAAWELDDAVFDRALPKHEEETRMTKYPENFSKAHEEHVSLLHATKAYQRAIIALIILTFWEVPPWCHGKHDGNMKIWSFQAGADWCPLPSTSGPNKNPNLSGISYLPPGYAFIAEIAIQIVIVYKLWCEYTLDRDHFLPMNVHVRKRITNLGFFFAVGSIIDTALFMIIRLPFRLTFIFRTGQIFLLPKVQHIFVQIFSKRVMLEFGSVAIFLVGTMVFFAWVAFTIFGNADGFSYMDGEEKVLANKGFTSVGDSLNTMFVGGVTGDFIDCFLPSFNVFRGSGLIWMVYLLLTQVLFKNLVMDTLISAYLNGKEEEEEIIVDCQIGGMTMAFEKLSEDGETISKSRFVAFTKVLGGIPRWHPISPELAEMIYDQFEPTLNKTNFVNMCVLLQSEFVVTDFASPYLEDAKKVYGDIEEYVLVSEDPEHPDDPSRFDKLMNRVLGLNLVMVVIESVYDLWEIPEPGILSVIEIAFSFVYLGEVLVKLMVVSFGEYWASVANRFDFFTTWLLLTTSMLKYLPFSFIKADLAHYANIMRLLRLIRILKQLKRYPQVQFMLAVISRIAQCAGEVLMLMGTFFFFFCCLAVNMFGGLLYEGNPALEGSEYAEKHWYVLNFNDMFMAFMMWFVQILCEYVPNYSDSLQRTATAAGLWYGWYSPLIIGLFYITTAAIMYELLLAFTVDVFMAVKEEPEWRNSEDENEEVREEREEEKAEKEEAEKDGSSSSSSSSEDDWNIEEFLASFQEKVFAEGREVVHFRMKTDFTFQSELKEKYVNIVKGMDSDSIEHDVKDIVKAAWLYENGVCHQLITSESKNKELENLRNEKEEAKEAGDKEREEKVKKRFEALESEMDTFPDELEKARADHIEVLLATNAFYKAIVAIVLLTLTEVPAWCHENKAAHLGPWSWARGSEWCRAPKEDANLYLSGIWYFPPGYALVFEIVCEVIILRRFMKEYEFEKKHFMDLGGKHGNFRYSYLCNIYVGCFCSIGSIIDTAVFTIFRYPFRFTFIFRTGLLCLLPGVQRLSIRIFSKEMMGQFLSVAYFFIGTVLFFAWIAVTMFKDENEIAFQMGGKDIPVNLGFTGLQSSIYTMFLAGMSEGFDDIFIPTVTTYRGVSILWLAFLVLTQVLFLNLVIDAFVAAYLEGSENLMSLTAHAEAKAVYHTSLLLFDDEKLDKDVFIRFVQELSRSPRMKSIEDKVTSALYDHYAENNGEVTPENFCDLISVVQNLVWEAPQNSPIETMAPDIWNSGWFKNIRAKVWEPADAPWFDEFMDTVLLFNLVFIVVQSMETKNNVIVPEWMHLSELFTLVYIWEVGVKLAVKSWGAYWGVPANRFDFFATWLLAGTSVLKYLPIAALQQDLVRYANLLRLLRLLRVVKKLKRYERFQFMVGTVVKMVERAVDILQLLSVCLFLFTTFGVNFFGGLLYEGNPALAGSDYESKHWFVFNFNDPIMGFTTWFTQLLCEYAPEWADALWRVSAFGDIAWYIYPIFYIFGVAIVFEILTAFTIETYLALKEEADGEADEESDSEDEDDAFEMEDEIMSRVTEKLKAQNKGLHMKRALLQDLQKKIQSAWLEELEESEEKEKNGEEKTED